MSRVPAEQRREQLIEATIDLAIREGLAATSVRRIADEANVSLGVVHYCFSSKEALLNAVAESFATPILGPVARAIDEGDSLESAIEHAFDTFWQVTQSAPGRQLLSYELAAWSIRGDGEAARLLYQTYLDVIEGFITHGLGLQSDEGVQPRILARMVLALTDGVSLAWLVDRDDAATAEVLRYFVGILVGLVRQSVDAGLILAERPVTRAEAVENGAAGAEGGAEPSAEPEPAPQASTPNKVPTSLFANRDPKAEGEGA